MTLGQLIGQAVTVVFHLVAALFPTPPPTTLPTSTVPPRPLESSTTTVLTSKTPTISPYWEALIDCESSNTNVTTGPYYGYFQFDDRTWQSLGYTGHASDHDFDTQFEGARELYEQRGRSPWPNCP